jgi:hypothetical protein
MDKTKLAVAIFDRYANQYQDKFMDMDLYHDPLTCFVRLLKKKSKYIRTSLWTG